jgi:hypothetical protein
MSNDVVVIRTFGTELEANIAKAELDNAGIHSILLTSGDAGDVTAHQNLQLSHPIGLAVLQRDAETAEAILGTGSSG